MEDSPVESDKVMPDVEDGFISLNNHRLWTPPFKLRDCSMEYLHDCPVPYNLLVNPFKHKKGCDTQGDLQKESQIWLTLGSLNLSKENRGESPVFVSSVSEPSLFYAKSVPSMMSKRAEKLDRKTKRKAKLEKWYDLPRGELTKEAKEDLELISKRRVLGLDLHTRKADGRHSHFQLGEVVDDPGSFYDRIPRRERRKNLVDELLANADYVKKQRRQYSVIQKQIWEKKSALRRRARQQQKKAGNKNTITISED